jgi:hypothetical protein
MSRKLILYLAGAVIALPAAAYAQTRAIVVEEPGKATVVRAQGGGGRGGAVIAMAESKIVTGRPYSAEAVTETTQVLGDGNRINRQSAVRVYRDSEGRTRREILAEDASVRTISISDPVGHVNYTLNPKEKIAYKAGGNIVAPVRTPGGTYSMTGRDGSQATFTARPSERQPTATATLSGGRGGRVLMRTPEGEDPNVKKEELGPQNIEGVMATGSRTTTVIPAGQIGNAQEIRIVSERWFSDELQALVLTRHNDPRSGETVYRLRNILRAEPDPGLFTVPADYTVQERGIRQRQ